MLLRRDYEGTGGFVMSRGFKVLICLLGVISMVGAANGADKVHIGISQIVEHPALDATRKGFIDYLNENGYPEGEKVEYTYKNAQNNRPVSGQIAKQLVGDKVDLILTIATPSSQDVAALTDTIPVLFSAVTDPVAAGLVKSLEKPGGNISGTMDKSPVSAQMDLLIEFLPKAKTIGTLYNAGEVNSVSSVNDLKKDLEKRGMKIEEATAANSGAVKMGAQSLVGKVDAIHVPTDNTVVLAFESVVKVCSDNKIPLFAADTDSVKRGAIAALAVDYYKLGRQTGEMAKKILDGDAKVGELPVEYQKEMQLYLNPSAAEKMGVEIPKAIKDRAEKIVE
jgi:putative ABC transport system substrate-binding protein